MDDSDRIKMQEFFKSYRKVIVSLLEKTAESIEKELPSVRLKESPRYVSALRNLNNALDEYLMILVEEGERPYHQRDKRT